MEGTVPIRQMQRENVADVGRSVNKQVTVHPNHADGQQWVQTLGLSVEFLETALQLARDPRPGDQVGHQ